MIAEIERLINTTNRLRDQDLLELASSVDEETRNVFRNIINQADLYTVAEISRIESENNIKIKPKTVDKLYEIYRFFYIQQYIISLKTNDLVDSYYKEQTQLLSEYIKENDSTEEVLEESLPKAYALAMNSCRQSLDKTPYMVQVIGAISLNDGVVSEMATGEGKTITSAMPAYLNALTGKGAHIVTPNSYLAKRDFMEMRQVYSLLGLTSGYTSEEPRSDKTISEKQAVYQSDIVYGSASAFAFDYLNDTLETEQSRIVLRPEAPNFAIIDEVDAVLFDDAAVPYNIAGTQKDERLAISDEQRKYTLDNIRLAIAATKELDIGFVSIDEKKYEELIKYDHEELYRLDSEATIIFNEKTKEVTITSLGYAALFCYYKRDEIYPLIEDLELSDMDLYKLVLSGRYKELSDMFEKFSSEELINYYEYINNAAKSWYGLQLDKDYILKRVVNPLDKNVEQYVLAPVISGRSVKGRHYSEGIQQALEAKEKYLHPHLNLKETKITNTLASIPASSFFARYGKVAGMTGTSVVSSFEEIYKLSTDVIPRNKKKRFESLGDVLRASEEQKFDAIYNEIMLSRLEGSKSYGQPLLITTTSIEKSHRLAQYLEERFAREGINISLNGSSGKIPVLNANVSEFEKEAAIVKNAGKFGAITIATEMAGRGTDIKLGGEVPSYEAILNKFISEYIAAQEVKFGRKFTKEEREKITLLAKNSEQIKQRTTKRYEMEKRSVQIDSIKAHEAGGLKVIGCGHFKYERVDNQVKGRSGRQGDVGCSKFFIDLDDLRELGVSEKTISKLQRKLKRTPNYFDTSSGQRKIDKIIKKAQKSAEAKQESFIIFNQKFESSVLEYRSLLFKDLSDLKREDSYIKCMERYIKEISRRLIFNSSAIGDQIAYSKKIKKNDIVVKDLIKYVEQVFATTINEEEINSCVSFDDLVELVNEKALNSWNELTNVFGADAIMPAIKKKVDTTLNRVWDRFMYNVEIVRNQYVSGALVNVGSNEEIKANIDISFDYSLETEIVDMLSSIFNVNYGKKGYYIDRLRDLEVTTSMFTTSNIDINEVKSSGGIVR